MKRVPIPARDLQPGQWVVLDVKEGRLLTKLTRVAKYANTVQLASETAQGHTSPGTLIDVIVFS